MALTLGSLARGLPVTVHAGDPGLIVNKVTADSRQAGPGVLFVAVQGTGGDGHDYVAQALNAGGAVAVASHFVPKLETMEVGSAGVLVADDTRPLPALLARRLAGEPDRALWTAAVTGTNGKTTVSYLLQGMLAALHGPCGLLGTIRYDDGAGSEKAPLTTPGGPQFYHWLERMVDNGCRSVAMELSSHGLEQGRAAGLQLDVAVMTNLGRDHLDYHGDMASYLAAKALIIGYLRGENDRGGTHRPGVLVLNGADPALAGLDTGDVPVVRFRADPGDDNDACDLKVVSADLSMSGTRLTFDWRGRTCELRSGLVGRFNADNLTAAAAAGLALELDPTAVCDALGGLDQVPGRMERFALPDGALAVVDYAHTPDALDAVLRTCDELTANRLLVVFGCGGDRDRGKRPLMGAASAVGADRVWITSDNPRTEDPDAIMADIARGYDEVTGARSASCRMIGDRTAAITDALEAAETGDIVVVAGKGHEDYQLVGDQVLDLDDRRIIATWIEEAHRHE